MQSGRFLCCSLLVLCLQLCQVSYHGGQCGDADASCHKQGGALCTGGCQGECAADLHLDLNTHRFIRANCSTLSLLV